jgi:hypothetical protein
MAGTLMPNIAGLAGVVAGGADHVLGGDFALVGGEMPFARRGLLHGGDFGLFVDLGAAAAGAFAQRHGEIGRGNVAVIGVIQRANDIRRVAAVAELGQGPESRTSLGPMTWKGTPMVLAVPQYFWYSSMRSRIGGETQVAGDVEAHVLAGLGGEALVQVHGVLVQLADRVAHVEQRQQARGMPGGTGRQFGALQQHHVGPSLQCEVVQRADADHAAANDYDAGMSFHVLDSPNANAPGSVTSTQLNMRLIATVPC